VSISVGTIALSQNPENRNPSDKRCRKLRSARAKLVPSKLSQIVEDESPEQHNLEEKRPPVANAVKPA